LKNKKRVYREAAKGREGMNELFFAILCGLGDFAVKNIQLIG
jgi:hypothetical protein